MQKPVVAYATGGIPRPSWTAERYLVPAGDHVAMAERLLVLLSHPAQRLAMGQVGRGVRFGEVFSDRVGHAARALLPTR